MKISILAGVGRTGTLVALDSLMQQLHDENQVSIFNTVYDMRHQRNFLVQSLVSANNRLFKNRKKTSNSTFVFDHFRNNTSSCIAHCLIAPNLETQRSH